MSTQITTHAPASALTILAGRLQCDPGKLLDTLKATVFKGATNEELMALTVVANTYGLNPLLKELYAFPAKGGGIVPVVSVDGWYRIMNDHPQMDGIQFSDLHEEGKLVATTCRIFRKDRTQPVEVTEYLSECKRTTDPWKMEHRMLRHKAAIQCARVAFGFSGIMEEDEADRIKVIPGRVVETATKPFTPPKAKAALPDPDDHVPGLDQSDFALAATPETALERLNRKISEEKLNTKRINEWLDRESLPALEMLMENEAEAVLAMFQTLKKEAAL